MIENVQVDEAGLLPKMVEAVFTEGLLDLFALFCELDRIHLTALLVHSTLVRKKEEVEVKN